MRNKAPIIDVLADTEIADEMPAGHNINALTVLNLPRSFAVCEATGFLVDFTKMPSGPCGPICKVHIEISLPQTKCYDVGQPRIRPIFCIYAVKQAAKILTGSKARDRLWFPRMGPVYFSSALLTGDKFENGWLAPVCYNLTTPGTHRWGYSGAAQKKVDAAKDETAEEQELRESTLW